MLLRLFQFSLRDQASNWLERLPAGSITTWEDLTTRFHAQFFLPGRTAKLCNDILMFQQYHGESLSEAWTLFKDLLKKVPHHGIDLWLQVQIFYDHANPVTRRTIDQSAGDKLRDRNSAGSITTWEDLTTHFHAQFFLPGRTAKLCNDILMFQQYHGESLSKAWTLFKDLLQKVPHHGIDLWLQLRDRNAKESWALLEDLALYDNENWNDPRDFAKPVKATSLPQDVPSTSDRRLIKLENQVQCLMEAHLSLMQPTQVNKFTTSYEICSGPHDTQYCMENPKQAFIEYASSGTDEARGRKAYLLEDKQIPSVGVFNEVSFYTLFQGSNNDINVIRQSHLLNGLKEGKAPKVAFVANDVHYKWGYYLTDGIYPEQSVLIKFISHLGAYATKRIRYKQAHEAARKDMEQALGSNNDINVI
ncbi:MAK10-like protein [Tanacetum coccineum]